MMTNNPNANLIEAMKEKLPLKGQLADMLMDTLYIGKEAVYRRLRGEVPFTLQGVGSYFKKTGYIVRQNYRTKFQIERHVQYKHCRL